jgi:hypothetical protein
MKRLLPLILLFLIGSVFAGEFQTLRQAPAALRIYMSLSARTYNSGKECRHAAAEVVTLAGQEGLPARVPMYWSKEDQTEGHTFPVLYANGKWWAIDCVFDDRKGQYIAITQSFKEYEPKRDISEYARFTHRPLLEYIGDATPTRITSWFDEETVWGMFRTELQRAREKLRIGEKILQLYDKANPGVWNHYLRATEKHQAAIGRGP